MPPDEGEEEIWWIMASLASAASTTKRGPFEEDVEVLLITCCGDV